MKWILIISLSCFSTLSASSINKTIDELLNDQSDQELNIPNYDPFKRAKPLLKRKSSKNYVYKPRPAKLTAIFNQKAFINGKWYEKGDSISEGKLVNIQSERVYLKQGDKTKVLLLKHKNKLLQITQKGEK